MEHRKISVLIVSRSGTHQKAIKTICASIPQIGKFKSAANTEQAIEIVIETQPDLLILGANLSANDACKLLEQLQTTPKRPYCIALTISDYNHCTDQQLVADQIISTKLFADSLTRILNTEFAH